MGRTYIRWGDEEATHDYVESDGRKAGISDKELTGLIFWSLAGLYARPDTFLFGGAGNLNAVGWTVKG